ncbi:MAG: hypothetical protein JSW73_03465 [Candidatus Woesearchaeota archaeon]|nr:MAG: hypothetical protein JSW73_03465 [Candidatus Woesearchaeota archaeon]
MVKKAQFYIIEATLAGVVLIVVISSIIYSGNLGYTSSDDYLLNNYCEDSLQVLTKRDLLQDNTESLSELDTLLPNNIIYCLRIDNQNINNYGCSKLKDRVLICKSIYTYIDDGNYTAVEVQLLLS